jgi:hypothetical protein
MTQAMIVLSSFPYSELDDVLAILYKAKIRAIVAPIPGYEHIGKNILVKENDLNAARACIGAPLINLTKEK